MKVKYKIPKGFRRVKTGQTVKTGDYSLEDGAIEWTKLDKDSAADGPVLPEEFIIRKTK